MKICVSNLIILLLLSGASINAQTTSTPGEWLEDIDYLTGYLEAHHPDLYANVSENEFQKAVTKLKKSVPQSTDREIIFGIQALTAMVKDMHTGVTPWTARDSALLRNFDLYPVPVYKFTDGLYIVSTLNEMKELLGCKIIKFGSLPAEEVLEKALNVISGDNPNGRIGTSAVFLTFAGLLEYCGVDIIDEELTLTLLGQNGNIFTHTLQPILWQDFFSMWRTSKVDETLDALVHWNELSPNPLPLYVQKPGNAYWYEYLPEHNILYVKLKDMQPKSEGDFDRFYAEVLETFDEKKAEKLVLDVRLNGGGDHFEMPLLKGVIARPHLDKPDNLFVIVSRITGSASQHFATQFDMYTNATFIGENTGGRPNHYGAQRSFTLPNSGLPLRCSFIYHQDATEWDMADCTRPDFLTPLSSKQYFNNEDPALNLIFTFDEVKNLKEVFKSELSRAYESGGYENLERAYHNFIDKHGDTGINRGLLINDFLFWLMPNRKSTEDYKKFLMLYTEEAPGFTDSWFALGQRYEIEGNTEMAERYYRKALEVFPGNTIAERRLKLIYFKEGKEYK